MACDFSHLDVGDLCNLNGTGRCIGGSQIVLVDVGALYWGHMIDEEKIYDFFQFKAPIVCDCGACDGNLENYQMRCRDTLLSGFFEAAKEKEIVSNEHTGRGEQDSA